MNHFLKLTVVAALAGVIPVTAAVGQAAFDANEAPADIYGYRVDVTEADDGEKTERALTAMREAKSVAQEIQMTFGVNRFRFVPLGSESLEQLRPEMEKRQDDLVELRTAVEASALFYTALKQEALNSGDVVAVELAEPDNGLASEKRVTVYLAD